MEDNNIHTDSQYEIDCIGQFILQEERDQENELQLIASENYISENVKKALGSCLNNRYSEGMPGYKYYGGQKNLENIENKAIELACRLFRADHANVQPHSGAQANMAVYNAWCEPGDTILGLSLDDGGHLTHGSPITQAAKIYNFVSYGLDENGYIDLEDLKNKIIEHQPKIILIGYSAYPRIPDFNKINEIRQLYAPDSLLMADMAHVAGLIAGGVHPNPLDAGFDVMNTTTHKTLRGPRGGLILTKGKVSNPLKKPEHQLENIPTLVDRSVFPGTQGGPICQNIAGKAICFAEALNHKFEQYAEQVVLNAQAMAMEFDRLGVTMQTGGTDNHLILIDVKKSFGIDGKEAEQRLEKYRIITNKNAVHGDTGTKAKPDGLRIGTAAITTRGFEEIMCQALANLIVTILRGEEDPKGVEDWMNSVTKEYPII